MLAKKNRRPGRMLIGLLLAMFIAGCMPAGPKALLRGKKSLDAGDYLTAVDELRTATTLLPNNAAAWNYLGVAFQKVQQPDEAAAAYQRALSLDRDLVEAHWNLGMLYLEQGKNEPALAEFSAYTLRRSYNPDGWLKLGAIQLRLGQIVPAEQSFSWVQNKLNPGNAEALNGLGLARLERNRPREAIQFFAADNQLHPGYAAAILNLAVTAQQYLRDNRLALQYYHAYLALTPHPDNWDDVSALANTLEQAMMPPAAPPSLTQESPAPAPAAVPTQPQYQPPTQAQVPYQPPPTEPRNPVTYAPRQAPPSRPPIVARSNPPPVTHHPQSAPAGVPVVKNQPPSPPPTQPILAAVPTQTTPPENSPAAPAGQSGPNSPSETAPPPATAEKPGFWNKLKPTHWFADPPMDKKYETSALTPPATGGTTPGSGPAVPITEIVVPEKAHSFPRYNYQSPSRPEPGDRRAAAGCFTRARVFEQASQWNDAMDAYRTAAEFDPSWFEAQYNYGVLAYRLGVQQQALIAYETALAIQPDSADARYNFALALKAAGYITDAVEELKKVIAAKPDEVRAHLALANLYAQKMHNTALAREQYLKVLDLAPDNPQAADIRYWLSVNAP